MFCKDAESGSGLSKLMVPLKEIVVSRSCKAVAACQSILRGFVSAGNVICTRGVHLSLPHFYGKLAYGINQSLKACPSPHPKSRYPTTY